MKPASELCFFILYSDKGIIWQKPMKCNGTNWFILPLIVLNIYRKIIVKNNLSETNLVELVRLEIKLPIVDS